MPKEIQVTRYLCEFCEKEYKHKSSARTHEKICFLNPEVKACRSCKNAEKRLETVYTRSSISSCYDDEALHPFFLLQ